MWQFNRIFAAVIWDCRLGKTVDLPRQPVTHCNIVLKSCLTSEAALSCQLVAVVAVKREQGPPDYGLTLKFQMDRAWIR